MDTAATFFGGSGGGGVQTSPPPPPPPPQGTEAASSPAQSLSPDIYQRVASPFVEKLFNSKLKKADRVFKLKHATGDQLTSLRELLINLANGNIGIERNKVAYFERNRNFLLKLINEPTLNHSKLSRKYLRVVDILLLTVPWLERHVFKHKL